MPLSPNWFSTVRLPYAFDSNAKCQKWEAFLEKNLQLDPQRIKTAQEWAGYCLTPDTGYAKFLVNEGEGSNGKSVFVAGLMAMIGLENCSYVDLENFGDSFEKSDMIGKLVNICSDANEVDKVAEGQIKSITSGDVVHFKRKHISGISCVPTARLVINFNQLPKIADKSSGIWRRMLLLKWLVEIQDHEKILNMDKAVWWQNSGELSGMFNWALVGLSRLRSQNRFTDSDLGRKTVESHRDDSSPARRFLKEFLAEGEESHVRSGVVFKLYKRWCEENNFKPLSDISFGREVKRVFKNSEKTKGREGGGTYWKYAGIDFTQDEVCGVSIHESTLF